jgi:tetratricopeptide (TPR) repeat protein
MKDFSKALELEPHQHPEAWSQRGYLRYQRGDHTEALQDFERAYQLNRESAYAAAMAGYSAFLLGEYARAVEWLTVATQLNPRDSEVLEYRARAHVEQSQWAEAIRDVGKAIELNPSAEHLRIQRCWYELYSADLNQAAVHAREPLALPELDVRRRLYLAVILHLGSYGSPARAESGDLLRRVTAEDDSVWPGPVLRFLREEMDREQLEGAAETPDQRVEARVFAAWLDLAESRGDESREVLRSVVATERGFMRHLAKGLLTAFDRDGSPVENGQP